MTYGEPAYPLLVALLRGRVQHAAKANSVNPKFVHTLCRKRGIPVGDGAGLPYCRACRNRPNPISQQVSA